MPQPSSTRARSASSPQPDLRRGFAVVDVETSGLDPARHRVIEVAVTQLSASGALESEWSSLVRARGGTGPVHVHGLTTEDLRNAPTFEQIVATLKQLLDGRILVAHNAAFDWAFLATEAARAGTTLPVTERLCTVHLARSLDLPTENLRLGTLAKHWSIPVEGAHRAADDVRVLVAVLARCLDAAGSTRTPLPLEACAPLPLHWRVHLWRRRTRRWVRARTRPVRRRLRDARARRGQPG